MSRFRGTRVVVVGGAGGIGGRIAERFAEEGADTIVLDLVRGADPGLGGATSAGPGRGILHCDLVDAVSVEAAFAVALAELGGIDVLVNSAGILARGSLLDLTPERWDLVMDINATLIILAPVLAPLTVKIGMDPVHAGIMIILALNISLMTPPVGACLFVLASVTGEKVEKISAALWPFILGEIAILLVVAYWADLTLFIPRLLGL